MEERQKRLIELKKLEDREQEIRKEALIESRYKAQEYATLSGRVERTYRPKEPDRLVLDSFTSQGILNFPNGRRYPRTVVFC